MTSPDSAPSSGRPARRRRSGDTTAEDLQAVLAKIARMPEPDRDLVQRLHDLILDANPTLTPRLWYGMPAYALEGRVVCFVQSGLVFKTRYTTLGFRDAAHLDRGLMWPTSYAVADLGPAQQTQIRNLIRRATGVRSR